MLQHWLHQSPKENPWGSGSLFDLQMDIIAAPARRPLPTGEQKPWDFKTGRVTTQPSRKKTKPKSTSRQPPAAENTAGAQASSNTPLDGQGQPLNALSGVGQGRQNERQFLLSGLDVGESTPMVDVAFRDVVATGWSFIANIPPGEPTAQQVAGGTQLDSSLEEWCRDCTTLYEDGDE
jgi:hypothetical protein